jgi:peptidoglycan/xylan/chitin deacetylase (PgdA/CDA1 family)
VNESAGAARGTWAGVATGYGFGLVLLPIVTLSEHPSGREVVTTLAAVLVATAVAALFLRRVAGRGTWWAGPVLVALSALLYDVTPAGLATAIIALLLGAGVGLSSGAVPVPGARWSRITGFAASAVMLAVGWAVGGAGSSLPLVVAVVMAVVAVAVRLRTSDLPVAPGPRRLLLGVALVGVVGLVLWTGMNDPQLTWFGPVSSHGPAGTRDVALTFDDGPNATYSLEIARILDDHGVKGTFFEVGKAVVQEPQVSKQLVADGHLIGNHSYHHDYWHWLDPRYLELGSTQDVIERDVGVCPRFFRPPHGQRTPFMNLQIARRGMVTVTWDVSAGDWATDDGDLVAKRILDRVHPGSIILLHDSIDGHVHADRRVILAALPKILDGLERKGLHPVRIDRMLGGPAYLDAKDC